MKKNAQHVRSYTGTSSLLVAYLTLEIQSLMFKSKFGA